MQTTEIERNIAELLKKHNIPVHNWGTNGHRSIADFIRYAAEDKFILREKENGLVVEVHAAVVVVIHYLKRKWLELYEDRQVFRDGKILRRKNFNGIAETLKRDEMPVDGAMRGLKEELGFYDPQFYHISECLGVEHRDPVPSEKWPGLNAQYNRYIFECVIERKLFLKDGYMEQEKDGRRIFFQWRPRRQLILPLS